MYTKRYFFPDYYVVSCSSILMFLELYSEFRCEIEALTLLSLAVTLSHCLTCVHLTKWLVWLSISPKVH